MMTAEEVELLRAGLEPDDAVFEWGSGDSTVWLASRVAAVTSIEHDLSWYGATFRRTRHLGNVDMRLISPRHGWIQNSDADGNREHFDVYVDVYGDSDQWDVVIVDGRARVDCIDRIVAMRPERLRCVYLHDCQRAEYARAFEVMRLTDRVGNLARLVLR